MKIDTLSILQFRNIAKLYIDAHPKLNLILGENGQGKTSLLEAISYLSYLRSFKNAKMSQLIQSKSEFSELKSTIRTEELEEEARKATLKVAIQFLNRHQNKAKKVAFINDKAYPSSMEYIRERFRLFGSGFHAIVFHPADHQLIQGEPKRRRDYLDQVLASEDFDYLKAISFYKRALDQRNRFLKSENASSKPILPELNEQLVENGSLVVHKRLHWFQRLMKKFPFYLREIAPQQTPLMIALESSILGRYLPGQADPPSVEEIRDLFYDRLKQLEKAELELKTTLAGPHRGDWGFWGQESRLKEFGSQGEIRAVLLALKLTEIELFQEETGIRPILLLDDFSSELDRHRRTHLLSFLHSSQLQAFVTTTEDFEAREARRFWMENGKLKEGHYGRGYSRESVKLYS